MFLKIIESGVNHGTSHVFDNIKQFSFVEAVPVVNFDILNKSELVEKTLLDNLAPIYLATPWLNFESDGDDSEGFANDFSYYGLMGGEKPNLGEKDKLGLLILRMHDGSIVQMAIGEFAIGYMCNDSGKTIETLKAQRIPQTCATQLK